MSDLPSIVLVHGAWADGSSWDAVIRGLQAKGYKVTAPQFPENSTEADVARLRQVLARQDGPTIVAGHSYGGQIMTALGTDAPNVVGLVTSPLLGSMRASRLGRFSAPARRRRRSPTSKSMRSASGGCLRPTSSAISPPMWNRPRPASCARFSNRSR